MLCVGNSFVSSFQPTGLRAITWPPRVHPFYVDNTFYRRASWKTRTWRASHRFGGRQTGQTPRQWYGARHPGHTSHKVNRARAGVEYNISSHALAFIIIVVGANVTCLQAVRPAATAPHDNNYNNNNKVNVWPQIQSRRARNRCRRNLLLKCPPPSN